MRRLMLMGTLGIASTAPETWLEGVDPIELVVDDEWVYWTESRLKEYDDRDVYVLRAAVYRRRHKGGPRETLFEFQRDDTYCLPQNLSVHRGTVGWMCRRPILDGHGRADASRYVTWSDGRRTEHPAPWAQPDQVATSSSAVFFVGARRPGRASLVDGHRR